MGHHASWTESFQEMLWSVGRECRAAVAYTMQMPVARAHPSHKSACIRLGVGQEVKACGKLVTHQTSLLCILFAPIPPPLIPWLCI